MRGWKVSPGERVMATGADLVVGGGCPPHMVYVRVAPDLKARSWGWSQAWHHAFTQTVSHLRTGVAGCVMDGLPIVSHAVVIRLPAGACIEVRVTCSGTQIVIRVLDFMGPHDPGPGGGICPPRPAHGSAHGAYSTGRGLHLVPFYEPMRVEGLVDVLRQQPSNQSATSAGMQRSSASRSRRHPTATTIVRAPKVLTFAFSFGAPESRNVESNAIARNSLKPAIAKLPTPLSSRSQPGIAIDADLRATRWSMSNPAARFLPARRIIDMKTRCDAHAGPDFDRSAPLPGLHSRHIPQRFPPNHVLPPAFSGVVDLPLH
jgi:hypothetical protein